MPDDFAPSWWLRGAHQQTIIARALRRKGLVRLNRQRWTTPDGDFLDIDFVDEPGLRDDVLVLVLHGLEGSSHSGYAFQFYHQLARRGIRAAGLNFRSCSGEANRARRLYHSGETEDPAWVITQLGHLDHNRRLAAVGVSLGGNVLLKYLGEQGSGCPLEMAAAMSVPFDLAAGSRHMEQGFSRLYVRRLIGKLQRKLVLRRDELQPMIDLERALEACTFWEFDDAATAPLHGFASAEDYYRHSSSCRFLAEIATPTLIVHSRDDPFLPASAIPEEGMEANPFLVPTLTDHGGHVGFMNGTTPIRPIFWAEATIADWFASRL